MKRAVILLAVFLAGCAASPEKLKNVGASEASRLAEPSKPFSSFSNYRMQSIRLTPQNANNEGKVAQAEVLEKKIREKLTPLFSDWSSSGGTGRAGTMIVQPELISLKIVSGGARFWAGAFAGSSSVDLDLKIVDSGTNKVIAKPRIARHAGAMTGAWSIGQSDENLHDYIASIVYEYLVKHY